LVRLDSVVIWLKKKDPSGEILRGFLLDHLFFENKLPPDVKACMLLSESK